MSTILETDELQRLTGYRRPADQLAELLRQGFYRARRSPSDGTVILERPHYDAVCQGSAKPPPAVSEPTAAQLTDEQIRRWWASDNGLEDMDMCKLDDFRDVVRAVERKLGEAK
jgi:hypothetical protein